MSTDYSGNPANVTTPLVRTINGCANNGSGRIRVSTTVPHFFSTFDFVSIVNVVGTTEANGAWVITVIDSTHFDLNFSTFTHAYVSGGSAIDYSLTPAAQVPDDGESGTVASILSVLQLLLDRTQYLATIARSNGSQLMIAPTVYNVSYAANWAIGDDGTGAATGSRAVKTAVGTEAILIDITMALYPFNGRRITGWSPIFAVGQSHASVPAVLPTTGIKRTQSLTSLGVAPSADVDLSSTGGAAFPTPGSGSAYYNSGHLQSWDYTPDQNNVIATDQYRYYGYLTDESGANTHTLNAYFGFKLGVL